jgi:hypothetical protein
VTSAGSAASAFLSPTLMPSVARRWVCMPTLTPLMEKRIPGEGHPEGRNA